MKRFYINKSSFKIIQKAVKEKNLTYKELAEMINSSESTVWRICTGKTKNPSFELIHNLETSLNINIINALESSEMLIKRIEELESENKMLKQLLINKWQ